MAHFNGPRPLYRWQLGLLLQSLPRRFIPSSFGDLPPGRADQPVPYPVGQADPRQRHGLADDLLVLGNQSDVQGGRVSTLQGFVHALSVLPKDTQV